MRAAALLLCLPHLVAADDVTIQASRDLPAIDLIEIFGKQTGTTYVYPAADIKDRRLGGRYDLQVPRERLADAADFLAGQCGLDLLSCPPVKLIRASTALEARFRATGLDTEIQFDRGPGGWAGAGDAEGSLSAATVEALLVEARKGGLGALDILAAMGPRTPPTIHAIAGLLKDPSLRARAASTLVRFGFAARVVLPQLREAAGTDPTLKESVRKVEEARHPALYVPALATDTAPQRYLVRFETTQGDFEVEVHRNWAPLAADRFYNLVRIGFFDGSRFFRVLPEFVAQFGKSGDPEVNKRWHQATFKDEPVGESNRRGYVTFAKAQEDSRTTQVFVNLADNKSLDEKGFSPFGVVAKGMDVVDRLYSGYAEAPDQGRIHFQGESYLAEKFPRLDRIKAATIVE